MDVETVQSQEAAAGVSQAEDSASCYHIFTEGRVKIAVDKKAQTFYNPVQEFNRDLTISVLRQFVEDRNSSKNGVDADSKSPPSKRMKHNLTDKANKIRVLDALSASGLRALRFAKEVPDIDYVVANDFSDEAFQAIKRNAKLNDVEQMIRPSFGDAVDVMMAHRAFEKRFHVIDLDPYGSASIFLDSAIQAVTDQGLLMVTCTDTATLCGNTPEACFNKYGSVPLRHKCCHEFALRILLRCVDSHANRHGRYIKPLLCVSVDFYIRCFVQVFTSASKAKDSVTKLSHVLACTSCKSLDYQPLIKKTVAGASIRFSNVCFRSSLVVSSSTDTVQSNGEAAAENGAEEGSGGGGGGGGVCAHCGATAIHMAGPIWTDPLHDAHFVNALLERIKSTSEEDQLGTHQRLLGLLTVVSEEVHDVPLYYESDQLMNVVRCSVPKHVAVRSALLNAGYRCSISHCNPKALKTDAPVAFLWDICRTWAKQNNVDAEKLKGHPLAASILRRKIGHTVDFTLNRLAMPKSKTDCLLRFPDNKGKNWGPRCRAKIASTASTAQCGTSKASEC